MLNDMGENVRKDEVALTLMEGLNKTRDCMEINLKDDQQKQGIVKYVEGFL